MPYSATDFTGQTIIVTGSNVGLGLEAARHFVRLGASKVILACRSQEKGESAKQGIEESTKTSGVLEVWQVDLGSHESVKQFCNKATRLDRLDAVVENAGIATSYYTELEGMESTVTVNVTSTFLMALLLMPKLRADAMKYNTTPRLVIVASEAHEQVCGLSQPEMPWLTSNRPDLSKNLLPRFSLPSRIPKINKTDTQSPNFSKSSQSVNLHQL